VPNKPKMSHKSPWRRSTRMLSLNLAISLVR
jgi:hypothetical protein